MYGDVVYACGEHGDHEGRGETSRGRCGAAAAAKTLIPEGGWQGYSRTRTRAGSANYIMEHPASSISVFCYPKSLLDLVMKFYGGRAEERMSESAGAEVR